MRDTSQFGLQAVRRLRGDEDVDGIDGGGEEDRVTVLAGGVAQRRGQVTLPEADPAHKDDIGFLRDEAEPEEVLDLELVELFRPVPPELIQRLEHRETGGAQAPLEGALLADDTLAVEQALEELEVRPRRRGGLLGERGVMFGDITEFEIREVGDEGVHGRS